MLLFKLLKLLQSKIQNHCFRHIWVYEKPCESKSIQTNRRIMILLTRFPDHGSRLISLFTRCYYTHASIGLMEDHNTYYSFVRKGFLVEKAHRYIRPEWKPLPCKLYELPVSEENYEKIKEKLQNFIERRSFLKYSKLGVVLALFQIRHKLKNQYFCSQFVAEIVKEIDPEQLTKDPSLYFPKDLSFLPQNTLIFQGTLPEMLHSFDISSLSPQ